MQTEEHEEEVVPVEEEPDIDLLPGEKLQTRYLVKVCRPPLPPSLLCIFLTSLIQWCELPYTECTWELAEDIKDDQKVAEFHRHNTPLPKRTAPRPYPHEFVPLSDPTYKDGNKLRPYQVVSKNIILKSHPFMC